MGKLQAATAAVPTGSFADLVLRAVQATFTDAAQARTPLAGRKLFDLLDRSCGGQLAAWLGAPLAEPGGDGPALARRVGSISLTRTPQRLAAALPPVVLPQLWWALSGELSRWQSGGDWNSRLRISPMRSGPEMALSLTEPRRFGTPAKGAITPQARHGWDG